ncbi:uncharacterized protein MONBRDRAFT_22039 [Monosiga brevicollis MX1]|uniref:USP domain-containing protein n=1 Tax=Monosiga brevicollis TaxID=81824 RepID=A9UPD1_MONBE|nr:uncharacterized protein MONBRDRAFT_22039 [Monosiga brevicollis MX1]EDQ92397.1 predicted protein [Monosiga brevicollis MX1]|eukprot:XP_001742159.1 hypothetical protein [Monosiga brevicollis MX1]
MSSRRLPGGAVPESNGRASAEAPAATAVRGLRNLGNTCFYNAVIQSLARLHTLRTDLRLRADKAKQADDVDAEDKATGDQPVLLVPAPAHCLDAELNATLRSISLDVIPHMGQLAHSLLELLENLTAASGNQYVSVPTGSTSFMPRSSSAIHPLTSPPDPKPLFNAIVMKAPRFRGYQQQDSQELLRHLLDLMDDEDRTAVFGGKLASTIICHGCHQALSKKQKRKLEAQAKREEKQRRKAERKQKKSDRGSSSAVAPTRGDAGAQKKARRATAAAATAIEADAGLHESNFNEQDEENSMASPQPLQGSPSPAELSSRPNSSDDAEHAQGNGDRGSGEEHGGHHAETDCESKVVSSFVQSPCSDGIMQRRSVFRLSDGVGLASESSDWPDDADADEIDRSSEPRMTMLSGLATQLVQAAVAAGMVQVTSYGKATTSTAGPGEASSLPRGALFTESTMDHDSYKGGQARTNGCDTPVHGQTDARPHRNRTSSVVSVGTVSLDSMIMSDNVLTLPPRCGTLAPMYVPSPNESSVASCLAAFCAKEELRGTNAFLCQECGRRAAADAAVQDAASALCPPPHGRLQMETQQGQSSETLTAVVGHSDLVASNACLDDSDDMSGEPGLKHAFEDTSPVNEANGFASNVGSVRAFAKGGVSDVSSGTDGTCSSPSMKSTPSPSKPIPPVAREASKQLLIELPPTVLTLHLKRFEQHGTRLSKSSRHVSFPLVLDIAPFCSTECSMTVYSGKECGVRYELRSVVVHQGRLTGGHYVAYVRTDMEASTKDTAAAQGPSQTSGSPSSWYCVSDASVRKVAEKEVLAAEAYILFYERLG